MAPTLFYGQENKTPYFPQEQIVHPLCQNTQDTAQCIKALMGKKIHNFVNAHRLNIISENDTLAIAIHLKADKKGKTEFSDKLDTYLEGELNTSGITAIKKELAEFIGLEIKNLKDRKYESSHTLSYGFSISNQLNPIILKYNQDYPYTGGTIQEIPLFPGCKPKLNSQKRKICFNKKMKAHIAKNFNYPKKAMEMGISGKVSIMFTIGEDGIIRNKRYKSPHPLLTQEANRIVSKLPKMIPGKINGKPVKIPFAIPITFRL